MKAKDLIKILEKNPECELIVNFDKGYEIISESLEIITFYKKGEFVNIDGGDFLDEDGYALTDLILVL